MKHNEGDLKAAVKLYFSVFGDADEEGPSMNICLDSRAIYLNQNNGTPVQEIYTKEFEFS
jgi:hypothetical protein